MKKMKTRILLGALAFPLVFAACTNDEFEVNNAGQQQGLEGDMVELPENFSLVGVKADNADTRGGMIDNQMGWYPTLKVDAGEDGKLTAADLNLEANWDQIGLAWLNVTPGSQVYSNYKFANYGWLYTNEDGVDFDECNDYILDNGIWFNGTNFVKHNGNGGKEVVNNFDGYDSDFAFDATRFNNAGVKANKGIFRTSLGTIFKGDYLVYYPFNEEMVEYGYLKAISPTVFNNLESKEGKLQDYRTGLVNDCFLVGKTSILGGTQSSDFTLGQLSGFIVVDLKNTLSLSVNDIASVVLYARDGGFYTSIDLDAAKITSDPTSVSNAGAELYVNPATAETSKTLISYAYNYDPEAEDKHDMGIDIPGFQTLTFGFAALPATINEYTVIVQDKNGNSAIKTVTTDPLKVTPLGVKRITVELNSSSLSAGNLYAYDETSFRQAVEKATDIKPIASKIHLLGTVELTQSITIPGNVTIMAETAVDKLVLTRQKGTAVDMWVQKGANLECNVEIQGQGCCGLKPATLGMSGNLAEDYTITNYGSTITFGRGTTTNNRVESEINGTILNVIDPDNQDPKTNKPEIVVNAYTTLNLKGSLTNDGYITVKTAGTGVNGDDGTLNIYKNATLTNNHFVTIEGNMATQGNAFTNKSGATFTVKVGAQITGQGVVNEKGGEYICEVNSTRRYEDAINNASNAIHSTTLLRFIDTDTPSEQTYVLKGNTADNTITNKNKQVINFESTLGDGQTLKLTNATKASGEPIPAAIGKLTIVSGGFEMNHAALTMGEFEINRETETNRWTGFAERLIVAKVDGAEYTGTVNGDVNITKLNHEGATDNITFVKGVEISGNMTVTDMGDEAVIFPENIVSNIGGMLNIDKGTAEFKKATMNNIGEGMNVTANGKANFEANSNTYIHGEFDNEGQVSIIPQTMVGNGEVAANVYCISFTNFGDTSKWLNNSYPQDTLTE